MSYPNADPAQYPSGPTNTAAKTLLPLDRRGQAYAGGLIAGMGIAIGLVVVMVVVQQESPTGLSISPLVLLVLFLGLIVGLGLGMGMAAAVQEPAADSAALDHATPTDQPPAASS